MTDTLDVDSMPVGALLGTSVIRVAPDASLFEVAGVLAKDDIGAVVVGDEPAVVGVMSERDITRAVAAGTDMRTTRAYETAHTELIWCDATATVGEVAAEMMERWVRHVLVETGGKLVGIVSARGLLGVYATTAGAED